EAIGNAEVSGTGGTYAIRSTGVPAVRLEPIIKAAFSDQLSQTNAILYDEPAAEEVTIHTKEGVVLDPETIKSKLAARLKEAAGAIETAQVQAISSLETGNTESQSFSIVTRETQKEIVVGAIMDTMEEEIDVQPALTFKLHHNASEGGTSYIPIRESDPRSLGIELSDAAAASMELQGWEGGVALVLEQMNPPQSVDVLKKRLKAMRLQPGFEKYGWRESDVFGLTPVSAGSDLFSRLLVVVSDENYPLEDEEGGISPVWRSNLAEPEVELLQAALQRQTSLSQITQFDTQVSGEAQVQAYLALALSWLLIVVFVWFRFGNIRWGLAAVVALIHDVIIAVGAVALTFYIAGKVPGLGSLLMINEGFRIDLAMVAAMLTVIGYSVNDTIVVFDRIRENRGRLADVTPEMVNDSVSQTLSRTLLTFLTSLISVLIMYIFGGRGIHSFNFVLMIGLAVGTYSSIGVASQFLLRRRQLVAV
ncbi:MAG: protein translocase subunit SecF, partial [Phycisphaerae bacterium]